MDKDKKELFATLADEIDNLRGLQQKLKDAEDDRVLRDKQGEEFKAYLEAQNLLRDKFNKDLCRRLVNKVNVQSMVEVIFVFKAGVEARRYLDISIAEVDGTNQILSCGMYKLKDRLFSGI